MCCYLGLTSSSTSLQKYTQAVSVPVSWLERQFSRTSTCSSTSCTHDIYINKELCQKASEEILRQRTNVLHNRPLRHHYYGQRVSRPEDYISRPTTEFDFNMNYSLHFNFNPLLPPCLPPAVSAWERKEAMHLHTSISQLDDETSRKELKQKDAVSNTSRPISRHKGCSKSNVSQRACYNFPLRDVTQWHQSNSNNDDKHNKNMVEQFSKYYLEETERLPPSAFGIKSNRILTKIQSAPNNSIQSENKLVASGREKKVRRNQFQKDNKEQRSPRCNERCEHCQSKLKYTSIFDYIDCQKTSDGHMRIGRATNIHKTCLRSKISNPFLNSYSIDGLIGIGGGGTVYKGVRIVDQMPVAVKQVKREKVKRWENIHGRTVPQEIALMIRVCSHRSVIRLLDWYEFLDSFILVLEKPKHSVDLFEYLREVGKLLEKEACFIFKQIAQGVQYIHSRGVVHRDIKDENIVLNRNTFETKLIDFGCGTFLHDQYYKDFAGTPEFYPPEWFNEGQYRARSATVWSLGVLLFGMVCGEIPFRSARRIAQGSFDFKGHFSEEVKDLISWMMEKDPQARPSIHQVLNHPWLREKKLDL